MPNRLADAKSPYLRQHAENPVDWWPWGDDAFAEAQRRDVPVFLSIGYATCHWCHVMARESFEDDGAAAALNAAFVCVKVDREEHPDVDAVYMAACQAMTGHGGWPLTALLTPDTRRPFYTGTYLPRESRYGRPGVLDLAAGVREAWGSDRAGVRATADEVADVLGRAAARPALGGVPGPEALDRAAATLLDRFDAEHGGFDRAPRFPTPHRLLFLLRQWTRTGDAAALDAVTTTLRAMRRGGIHDHLGGGFHRYSTDARWLLPHFEKMLYDQALLLLAFSEAFQATGADDLRDAAAEIVGYVLRDLTSPEGAFFSAEDADSLNAEGEEEEGAFYVWTEAELEAVLGPEDAMIARALYGTTPGGNYADEATRAPTGSNVLSGLERRAENAGLAQDALGDAEERIRARLFEAREGRPRPLLDDKVLTDWNGLMIAALARAARLCGERGWGEAAARAADHVLATMQPDGTEGDRLLHRAWRGAAGIEGLLDDYAFLVWGLIEVYQTTFETRYLADALRLHRAADARFADEARGGWYLGTDPGDALFLRPKEAYDGALPSGQAVMTYNALRLARLTGQDGLEATAARAFGAEATVTAYPAEHAFWMVALADAVGPAQEVVVAGARDAADTRALLDGLQRVWAPHAVFLVRGEGESDLDTLAPFAAGHTPRDGRAAAYVCERHACQAPTTDPDEAVRLLTEAARPSRP
ncbi:MAG TPA: thioredoxin domain-containing protein [Rhodothermales bacterium]|nr:thioredoxin domain-containing protein [Rhodothermales bacterium]